MVLSSKKIYSWVIIGGFVFSDDKKDKLIFVVDLSLKNWKDSFKSLYFDMEDFLNSDLDINFSDNDDEILKSYKDFMNKNFGSKVSFIVEEKIEFDKF